MGIPVWYVIGIPFTFADVIGAKLGLTPAPTPATALFCCYAGCSLGGLACGLLSQRLRSRKQALALFLVGVAVVLALFFSLGGRSLQVFYTLCVLGGFTTGYWALFVSTSAELFGTNLRATATTTVPNFVRGAVPLLTLSFKALASGSGVIVAAIAVGAATLVIAFVGLATLPESFGVDLDFHES